MASLRTQFVEICFKSTLGVVFLLLGLMLLFLLIEGGVRISYHFTSRRFIHPYLGETYKPNHRQWSTTPDGESFEYVLNNYGFRGDDIPDRKLPQARYVFTLGGSTTACNEYPEERTWPGVLQGQLRHSLSNHQIHVYNAGMAGATSYRSLLILLNFLTRLKPDLVIVYEGVNDKGHSRRSQARYFKEIGHREEFIQRRSYLLIELARRTRNPLIMKMEGLVSEPWNTVTDLSYHEKNYQDMTYLARGYGIPIMFMTQPVIPQLGNKEDVNRSTLDLGRSLSVPVYNLASIMPLDYDHFLPDNVHYTVRGNQRIAEGLARWIVERKLL